MALIVSSFTIISRGHLVFSLLMMIVEDDLIVDFWFVDSRFLVRFDLIMVMIMVD